MTDESDKIAETVARLRADRDARRRATLVQLLVCVVLPTLLVAAYAFLVASPSYESVVIIKVQSGLDLEPSERNGPTDLGDAVTIATFANSREMLRLLDQQADFSDHFSGSEVDFFSRLGANAGSETTYAYYGRHVRSTVNEQSGDITLRVSAYDPKVAGKLAEAMLANIERRTSKLHGKSLKSSIERATKQVALARKRLVAARTEFSKLASTVRPLDAVPPAPDEDPSTAPPPPTAEERMALESAELEVALARSEYDAAARDLSEARRRSISQRRFVEVIAPPSQPDQPSGPKRLRLALTTFLVSLALYAIGSLLLASIREHARL